MSHSPVYVYSDDPLFRDPSHGPLTGNSRSVSESFRNSPTSFTLTRICTLIPRGPSTLDSLRLDKTCLLKIPVSTGTETFTLDLMGEDAWVTGFTRVVLGRPQCDPLEWTSERLEDLIFLVRTSLPEQTDRLRFTSYYNLVTYLTSSCTQPDNIYSPTPFLTIQTRTPRVDVPVSDRSRFSSGVLQGSLFPKTSVRGSPVSVRYTGCFRKERPGIK